MFRKIFKQIMTYRALLQGLRAIFFGKLNNFFSGDKPHCDTVSLSYKSLSFAENKGQ